MKKLFFLLFTSLILLGPNFIFAQNLLFPSQQFPPVINCGGNFFACLGFFFQEILQIIVVLSLILATIFIAWAGILYITKGSGGKEGEIHKRIIWAAVGLVVALTAFALVRALEIWLTKNRVFHPINIVFAQINEPSLPTRITCGPVSLPSVLEETISSRQGIWKICILFYLQRILSFLYVLSLMLGVIFIAWAGILYITQPQKTKETHSRLRWGVIGVVVSILSFTIVKIIDLFFTRLQ
jgi:uncharacterized membrane protein YjfL (UPF0719 family)